MLLYASSLEAAFSPTNYKVQSLKLILCLPSSIFQLSDLFSSTENTLLFLCSSTCTVRTMTHSCPLSLRLSRMAFISKKMIYLTSQPFNAFFFSSPLNISFGQRKFVPQRIKQARETLFNSIAVEIKISFQLRKEIELKSFQTKHKRVFKPGVS